MALGATKGEGAAVRELAVALALPAARVEARVRSLAVQGLVQLHPEGKQRKVAGRWAPLWVRSDALLDAVRAEA